MNLCELAILRQACGLSRQQVAEWLDIQNEKTVNRWETGKSVIPPFVKEQLLKLDDCLESASNATADFAEERVEQLADLENASVLMPLVLTDYLNDDNYRLILRNEKTNQLPFVSVHRALVIRTIAKIKYLSQIYESVEIKIILVPLRADDLFRWLEENGLDNREVNRVLYGRAVWSLTVGDEILTISLNERKQIIADVQSNALGRLRMLTLDPDDQQYDGLKNVVGDYSLSHTTYCFQGDPQVAILALLKELVENS
jgi:transcriptional regulator with XRE-family HTH domain